MIQREPLSPALIPQPKAFWSRPHLLLVESHVSSDPQVVTAVSQVVASANCRCEETMMTPLGIQVHRGSRIAFALF